MSKTEQRRLIKYALATYLSILAVFLFGFKMTTSIAFSAIFVISYGATRQSCLSYSLHRILAQLIGVACGGALYALITSRYAAFLPESQRMALAMTVGLVAVLALKYRLHLDIAEFTMFTPVFLVLLMTPGNAHYPVLRVLYCSIGIVIGIAVNFLAFPCPANRWTGVEAKLRREDEILEAVMSGFSRTLSLDEEDEARLAELSALETDITQSLQAMDSGTGGGRRAAPEETPMLARRHHLNLACIHMVRQISALPGRGPTEEDREAIKTAVLGLYTLHRSLSGQAGLPREEDVFALPGVEEEMHDTLLCQSEVITYYRHIMDALGKFRPATAR